MAKQTYPIPKLTAARSHELAEMVRAMPPAPFGHIPVEMIAAVRTVKDMATFCGCEPDDTITKIEIRAIEQWRACRKGK